MLAATQAKQLAENNVFQLQFPKTQLLTGEVITLQQPEKMPVQHHQRGRPASARQANGQDKEKKKACEGVSRFCRPGWLHAAAADGW